jgi:hypothetical protein
MSNTLTVVTAETPAPAPKKKREKIQLIETQPEANWFVSATTKRGRKVWYLRFRMTGRNPRLSARSRQNTSAFSVSTRQSTKS